jgi:hypothetical protein
MQILRRLIIRLMIMSIWPAVPFRTRVTAGAGTRPAAAAATRCRPLRRRPRDSPLPGKKRQALRHSGCRQADS